MNKRPNPMLFKPMINGNNSWAEIFQSINAFQPLIDAIFVKHELEIGEIENLTPGTNAVFRINDKVIKIFAPIESGYSTDHDYFTEISSLQHANEVRITAPFYYEWPSIVFALFGCNPIMMEVYFGYFHNDEFYDKLTLSLVIHEFGSNILQQIFDLAGISIPSITDINCLKALLTKIVDSGQMKVR